MLVETSKFLSWIKVTCLDENNFCERLLETEFNSDKTKMVLNMCISYNEIF